MTAENFISYIHSLEVFGSRPGLERITELCKALGDPQKSLRFIHVAGTNGKGSFCAMTESVLRKSGLKTGLYVSPFIERFNERIQINGKPVSDSLLAEIGQRVIDICKKAKDTPTEFEVITATAFACFAQEKCDVVVLETGLGGRLDATNIIDGCDLAVITGIALDHTSVLGNTTALIAAEKAGIIKKGASVLFGGGDEDSLRVIKEKCEEQGATLRVTDALSIETVTSSVTGSVFRYKGKEYSVSLAGTYQPCNAANVIEALEILKTQGYKITERDIADGLKEVRWPARFEVLCERPLIIFDGAHNPQGINAAVRSIKTYFNKKIPILTGILADKDVETMTSALVGISDKVYTVTPPSPRAMKAEELAEIFRKKGIDATPFNSIEEGVCEACKNGTFAVLGSLYMYGEIKNAVKKFT